MEDTYIVWLLARKRKINAIKYVREQMSWGLVESKRFVDNLEQKMLELEIVADLPQPVQAFFNRVKDLNANLYESNFYEVSNQLDEAIATFLRQESDLIQNRSY